MSHEYRRKKLSFLWSKTRHTPRGSNILAGLRMDSLSSRSKMAKEREKEHREASCRGRYVWRNQDPYLPKE